MSSTIYFTDPGAMLGKTMIKIVQVILIIMAVGCAYMAYLASEGFFSEWTLEIDSDLSLILPNLEPQQWIVYLSLGLAFKFLIWFGLLAWLDRKI